MASTLEKKIKNAYELLKDYVEWIVLGQFSSYLTF